MVTMGGDLQPGRLADRLISLPKIPYTPYICIANPVHVRAVLCTEVGVYRDSDVDDIKAVLLGT